MASTTPKMLLRMWDQLSDLFSHDQMADNWSKIDFHDHTPGRGVQIPTEGIFDGAITSAKLAPTLDPGPLYTTYKFIARGVGNIGASTASGTYILGPAGPGTLLLSGATAPFHAFYLDPADYAVSGRTTSFRIRGQALQNTTTPSGQGCTFQLVQIGGYTSGTGFISPTVIGSAVLAAPGQNVIATVSSSDFTVASAGYYALVYVLGSATAAASGMFFNADLYVRQV